MIALVVYYALFVFTLLLTARAILSFVPLLVRGWEPKGLVLVVAETVYTVTDGPLRVVGRLVPPLRIGVVALDMGFLLLFFLVSFAMRLISAFLM
ncbi:YggT family protein [Propionicicella superfundia]|uniref:YggT family protein n=1 Tax=Propionicicella superfundia TaxID=348582 RepID=UPI000683D763|nr:YggT family protein [Propionicicella superfundia]